MGSSCSVCLHPDRAVIDRALMAHEELRSIADRHGLSKSSVHRHRRHVGKAIVRAAARREERFEDDLLGDARDLRSRTYRLLDEAVETKDTRLQAVLIAQVRENIRFLGELTKPTTTEADTERALAWFSVEYDIPIDEMRAECKKVASLQADLLAGRTPPHTPPPAPFMQPWVPPPSPPAVVPVAVPQSEAKRELDGTSREPSNDVHEAPRVSVETLPIPDPDLPPPLSGPWTLTI